MLAWLFSLYYYRHQAELFFLSVTSTLHCHLYITLQTWEIVIFFHFANVRHLGNTGLPNFCVQLQYNDLLMHLIKLLVKQQTVKHLFKDKIFLFASCWLSVYFCINIVVVNTTVYQKLCWYFWLATTKLCQK